jgi:hypothetical protein
MRTDQMRRHAEDALTSRHTRRSGRTSSL